MCKENGIRQEFSATSTPMQNGQVERANRSIGEAMKAMLLDSGLHSQFWAEAAKMFVYTYNLVPRKQLGGRSPWSVFTERSDPPIPRFAFGEKISFWTEPEHASKLKPRGHLGLFVGPGISAAQTSFPGCHRVCHLEK